MNQRWMQGIVFLIGSRLMTIYLWHLPLVMMLTGIQLVLPLPLPEPGSAVWWWTRVPFTILVIAVAWLLSLWLGRYERPFPDGPRRIRTSWATTLAVVLFVLPPIGIAAYGLDFPLAAWGSSSRSWHCGSPVRVASERQIRSRFRCSGRGRAAVAEVRRRRAPRERLLQVREFGAESIDAVRDRFVAFLVLGSFCRDLGRVPPRASPDRQRVPLPACRG